MRKSSWIVTGVGVLLILLCQNEYLKYLGMLGIIIFVIGGIMITKDIRETDKKQLRDEINEKLANTGFTDDEIQERQKHLKESSKSELKGLLRELNRKLEAKKRSKFFEPLEKK